MIASQRDLFDIPRGVTYLNCAYMSPLLRAAAAAAHAGVDRKLHPWEIHAEDFFTETDDLRAASAQLFGCLSDDVAIVPSAGFGISTAAVNVPVSRGQKILVLEEQFPSNYYPWLRLAQDRGAQIIVVPWPEDGDWTSAVLDHLQDGVAVAALPQTQWTSGGLLDLASIGQECRRRGIALVLDLTQSLGAHPFSVAAVQPDFAVAATYKWLLGPYGLGVMYVAPKWQQGRPLEQNWVQRENARKFSDLVLYTEEYQTGARRFDVGERSNFALLPAAIHAVRQLLAWSVAEISSTIGAMNRRLVDGARELGIATAVPDRFRAPHYLCLRSKGESPAKLAARLAEERVYVSVRGASIRITPHVYNSEEDLERLLNILKATV